MKWAMLAAAVAALGARLLTGPHPIDDAYITFRYARNLAEGLGLTYNPGEWVLGTTTPLWAVLLAGAYRLGAHDLPWVAVVLSLICDCVSGALIVLLSRRMGWRPQAACLVGLAWAVNPLSIAFAVGGMETSLFVVLALSALVLASWRPTWAAGLAGLDALVRPEGILVALAIVSWLWLARRRRWPLAAISAAAPLVIGGLVLFSVYGSPLPNSVAAKQVAYVSPDPWDNLAALVLQAGLPGWSTYILAALPSALAFVLAVLGALSVGVLLRKARPWLDRRGVMWQPFALFGLLYVVFYTLVGIRGVRLFPWYLVPMLPLYVLGASAGLAAIGLPTSNTPMRNAWPRPRREWLVVLLLAWQLPAIDWRQPLLPAGYRLEREQVLLEVGASLAETLPSTALIAAPEIGALGYASNLRILDTVGLVSPAALRYYPVSQDQLVSDNAIPARLIQDQRPDVVVSMDEFARNSLLRDAAFVRDYQLARAYPLTMWESSNLWVFRRVEAAADAR